MPSSTSRHSPTPWVFNGEWTDMNEALIRGVNNLELFAVDSAANAAHIVLAVNAHPALVEALTLYQTAMDYARDNDGLCGPKSDSVQMLIEAHRKAFVVLTALKTAGEV